MKVHVFAEEGFGAVQAEALHAGSPFSIFVGYAGPALLAYGEFFAFEHDVQFYVFALAFVLPRVFAMFHPIFPPTVPLLCCSVDVAFKTL